MAVNEVGSVIIDSRSVPYSRGQSSEAIPRKNASRTICNSSFDVHFENRARVGLLAVKAVVNSISSRVMVTLPGKGPDEVGSTTYYRLASRQNNFLDPKDSSPSPQTTQHEPKPVPSRKI